MSIGFLSTRKLSDRILASTFTLPETRVVFTTSGTFTVPSNVNYISFLIVSGGGAGGEGDLGNEAPGGAGGGAGGVIQIGNFTVTPNSQYTITIGAAGFATSAFGYSPTRGGAGGGSLTAPTSGGSGGGGSTGAGAAGITGQGYAGGSVSNGLSGGAAGGGGAGAVGSNGVTNTGGDGGNGIALTVNGSIVGYYAGGGGGSTASETFSFAGGGLGGGGNGGCVYTEGTDRVTYSASPGAQNSGGGGGGGWGSGVQPGGSGVVHIWWGTLKNPKKL